MNRVHTLGSVRISLYVTGNRPWSKGIVRGKPEYEMAKTWDVEVLFFETGEVLKTGAIGTEDDALSCGRGLAAWAQQGVA